MKIGIHANYRKHDNILACLRIANFAKTIGHEVSILTPNKNIGNVDKYWDSFVLRDDEDVSFSNWLRRRQLVLWPEPPEEAPILYAQEKGIKTVILALWDSIIPEAEESMWMADTVVSPCKYAIELLREKWVLSNLIYIPWDCNIPITVKNKVIEDGRVKICIPLHGTQPSRTNPAIFNIINHILCDAPWVDITILCTNKSFNSSGYKVLKNLSKTFADTYQLKVVFTNKKTKEEVLLYYGNSDFCLWLSEIESIGIIGLESLSMGTPVVTYDTAPMNEFIKDGKNSVLLPCELTYNWLGVPYVIPDYKETEEAIFNLVSNKQKIETLKKFTRYGMAERKNKFKKRWSAVLTDRELQK